MEDSHPIYGPNCDIKKEIERIRTELNKSMLQHPLDKVKIMNRSTYLDSLILQCMECEVKECPYHNKP